jgi:hypothetical protein
MESFAGAPLSRSPPWLWRDLDPSTERWILRWRLVGVMVDHRIAQGRRQQITPMARMPLLAVPLAALAIALAAA